ncbi:MAG: winged helix-turn-helix domain-containing protein [Pseudomonadota bacterium]
MREGPDIARIAALIGDPARANMLTALMTGKALTVSELAAEAGVTLQTASAHLAKLDQGGMLRPRRQGRHKYFTIASDDVAAVLEGLMNLAAGSGHLRHQTGPKDAALRRARVCYNHLAGDLGTRFYDRLRARGEIRGDEDSLVLTEAGSNFARDFGIDLAALEAGKAPLCRECLDWSARRSHLAGSLGRAFLARFEALGWAQRDGATRVIRITHKGERGFAGLLATGAKG